MRERYRQLLTGGCATAWVAVTPALALDASSELAKKLSNPVASLISVSFQFNHNEDLQGGNGTQDLINVQPVIPISISIDWNVIYRTLVALDGVPAGGGGAHLGVTYLFPT